ncbi:hypothetical protein NKG95_06680 [Mesorhizobium sp. M1423]
MAAGTFCAGDRRDFAADRFGLPACRRSRRTGICRAHHRQGRFAGRQRGRALSLATLLAVLGEARLFLGNESGPMHMAAAAGTPVVGLFGLTDPVVWGPVGVASVTPRPSMPCECIARDLCRRPDPSKACCFWRLEVKAMVDAVRAILSRTVKDVEHAL